MNYIDLVALTRNGRINRFDATGKIIPNYTEDEHCAKYISHGLKIDLSKHLYRSSFSEKGNFIINGFTIRDGWYEIGTSLIQYNKDSRDLIGIYDITNFKHLQTLVSDAIESNRDWSNAD